MRRFILTIILTQFQLAAVNAFSTGGKAPLTFTSKRRRLDVDGFHLNAKPINTDGSQGELCEYSLSSPPSSSSSSHQRRTFLKRFISSSSAGAAAALHFSVHEAKAATNTNGNDINTILSQLKEARSQLDPIENLIKEEKWDSVRAILIKPPLSDCWAKTSRPLLKLYAEAMDEIPNGDELAVLELREEALDHLRFLDMAVYNNVFNPIKTEGETGATKELIRSYYEDPVKEFKACVRILDDLIALASS